MSYNKLTKEHLIKIWSLTKNNMKSEVYEMIKNI